MHPRTIGKHLMANTTFFTQLLKVGGKPLNKYQRRIFFHTRNHSLIALKGNVCIITYIFKTTLVAYC